MGGCQFEGLSVANARTHRGMTKEGGGQDALFSASVRSPQENGGYMHTQEVRINKYAGLCLHPHDGRICVGHEMHLEKFTKLMLPRLFTLLP